MGWSQRRMCNQPIFTISFPLGVCGSHRLMAAASVTVSKTMGLMRKRSFKSKSRPLESIRSIWQRPAQAMTLNINDLFTKFIASTNDVFVLVQVEL